MAISVENHNSPTPVFGVPAEGISYRHLGAKKLVMGLPGRERSLTISSAVWTQIHQRDGQTDTGRQQRPRFRITSRGKNHQFFTNRKAGKLRAHS